MTAKGLLFVQRYEIYELTVNGIVRTAINEMKGKPTPISTIRLELLGLALHPELTAVADCGRERMWSLRMELFRRVNSPDILNISDNTFPNDGSHYRVQQLRT